MEKLNVNFNGVATLPADMVKEAFTYMKGAPKYGLHIRLYHVTENLEHYQNIITTEGALDKITVSDEDGNNTVFEGYTEIHGCWRLMLEGGVANVSIELSRPNAITLTEDN